VTSVGNGFARIMAVDLSCPVKPSRGEGRLASTTQTRMMSSRRTITGEPRTCVFDAKADIALNDLFVMLIAWYDKERAVRATFWT